MANIKKAIADVGSGNALSFATGKVQILAIYRRSFPDNLFEEKKTFFYDICQS